MLWKKQMKKLEVLKVRKKLLRVLYHLKRDFMKEGIDLFYVAEKGGTRING